MLVDGLSSEGRDLPSEEGLLSLGLLGDLPSGGFLYALWMVGRQTPQ